MTAQTTHDSDEALEPPSPGQLLATLESLVTSLMPAEQSVARQILRHPDTTVELTSQELAELAGTSRATVVRTAQKLGFRGYAQLRVALAREHSVPATGQQHSGQPAETLEAFISAFTTADAAMTALLEPDQVDRAIEHLGSAQRLLVVGNGLSAGLALDTAARFNSIGRIADHVADPISQQICARLLSERDALLVCSGSGVNQDSLRAAQAARLHGATVVLMTAYQHSALTKVADIVLIVGLPGASFAEELASTTRIPQTILAEGLVAGVARRLGGQAQQARTSSLGAVAEHLSDE